MIFTSMLQLKEAAALLEAIAALPLPALTGDENTAELHRIITEARRITGVQ